MKQPSNNEADACADGAQSTPRTSRTGSGDPNDNLLPAERELRQGPAPLGEDGADPSESRKRPN